MPNPNHLFNNIQNYNLPIPNEPMGSETSELTDFGISTGAFGQVPSGPGIAIVDDKIVADATTLSGVIDPGLLP